MKKNSIFLLLVIIATVTFSFEATAKPTIAVSKPSVVDTIDSALLDLDVLTAELEKSLREIRKFTVLTRQHNSFKAVFDEQKKAGSNLFKANTADIGQLENAEFRIVPTVQMFAMERTSHPIPNISDKYRIEDSAKIRVSIQVLDTTSGEIKAAFMANGSAISDEKPSDTPDGKPEQEIFVKAVQKASADMADKLINVVFPMKVLKVSDSTIWINRGNDGGLKIGDILEVFMLGEELVDADTGENLGRAEISVGTIQVININPRVTIAEKINGDEAIEKDFIIRKTLK